MQAPGARRPGGPDQTADYRPRPRAFRRQRLLIIGCGDIGRRVAGLLRHRCRIIGLARSAESLQAIRQAGITALPAPAFGSHANPRRPGPDQTTTEPSPAASPVRATADAPATRIGHPNRPDRQQARLQRLAGWATHILHSAPPPAGSDSDLLTRNWLPPLLGARPRALNAPLRAASRLPTRIPVARTTAHHPAPRRARPSVRAGQPGRASVIVGLGRRRGSQSRHTASPPRRLVYLSTTGVYGNRDGAWVSETDAPRPLTERAIRRVAAERLLRQANRQAASRLSTLVLRVPGIYGEDRLPVDRLRNLIPALLPEDDVITNHIHADDLARIAATALLRTAPRQRIINAIDDSQLWLGEYLDLVADHLQMPRPPRFSRAELAQRLSPVRMSFMSESRRIRNQRLKRELRLRLRHPTVADYLTSWRNCNTCHPGGVHGYN